MKKSLLTLITLILAAVVFGQQNIPVRNEALANRLKYLPIQDGVPYSNPLMLTHAPPPSHSSSGIRTFDQVKFSSSHNGFMLLVSESQTLTYNNNLKLINFTQRAPESIVQENGGQTNATGIITNSFSTDFGLTWDTNNVVMSLQDVDNHCRYPSGGIYNPAGNTDPMQSYAVVGGPATNDDAANGWVKYYYGSMRLDSTNNDQQFYNNQNENTFQQMPRYSFTTCGDKAFVLGINYDYNTNQLVVGYQGGVINRGVFNGTVNKFDWSQINVRVAFALDPAGDQQFGNLGNLAFNDDGSVGYFVIIGVDSLNPVGYFPIVFKSVDFGQTWTLQSFYDFRDIPAWSNYLIPTVNGEAKPYFSSSDGFDAVVDHNNSLHLIGTIYGASTDNLDSLGYIWVTRPQIFDVFQNGDVWDATYIDTITASYGTSLQWTSTTPIGVDARIQAATSPDRTKLFVVWVDTDPLLGDINDYPDLKGIGMDLVNTGISSGVINFTPNYYSDFHTLNSWHYVSDRAFDNGNGTFTVPVTTSRSRDLSYSMDDVMDHYYVRDVTFSLLTGVPSVSNTLFTVDQNYPNPFSDQTRIKVTLDKASDLNLKITNILGQDVGNKNFSFSSGDHTITLNKGELGSGVYNFTVTADGKQASKTMIIK